MVLEMWQLPKTMAATSSFEEISKEFLDDLLDR